MKPLTSLDKNFISVAYAEERLWGETPLRMLMRNWDRIWTEVTFAETNNHKTQKADKKQPVIQCEIGDVSCFMLRNA